jgi:hypothetical protein
MFSQMKAAARRGWQRSARHNGLALKRWVRPLFAVYAVITTPILVLLLALLFIRAPLLVSALWTAIAVVEEKAGHAWATHHGWTALAAGLQLALVVLQTSAIAYILGRVTTRAAVRVWNWGQPTIRRRIASVALCSIVLVGLGSYWTLALGLTSGGVPADVRTYAVSERTHVTGPVAYRQSPPVGGPHSPVWQNCGFYSTPIMSEHAVHSMEHGAVWITYRPNLAASEVAALRVLAIRESYVLVSPYPGLPAPVVASAWNRQLRLESAGDPQLDQFVRVFRLGSQAPERGGLCTHGLGTPLK